MRFEQMLLTDSQSLPLQTGDALNQQARYQNQHQRHSHFRYDQKIPHALSRTTGRSGATALFQNINQVQAGRFSCRDQTEKQSGEKTKQESESNDSPIDLERNKLRQVRRIDPSKRG